LNKGSYELYFYDVVEDGMIRHWWLRGTEPEKIGDNGSILLLSMEGDTLKNLGFDFAEEESIRF